MLKIILGTNNKIAVWMLKYIYFVEKVTSLITNSIVIKI